ncbi:MAG: undecaprenyl-diphosphatase UppP [Gemmatimonadaceae bacterium]|nr:undecaprenyl-diphosphatase UppP [Gemmatimonadaceae bacterium]
MNVFQAIFLGVLQGLTEFLPVSSSAHLALAPWLFGWRDPGLAFDVALHLGTLVAVLWFFRSEWALLFRQALRILRTRRVTTPEQKRVLFLILATIPGGIAGVLFAHYAETAFRSPALIATTLIVMGVLLWAVDRWVVDRWSLDEMRWTQALVIGCAQAFAIIPGVSRSGSTITAGRALGFHRESAAVFSFLLSMPITAAAAAKEVPAALHEHGLSLNLLVGVIASAVSGWLAISVLLKYVARHSYGIFALYRILLGAIVLAVFALR